MARRPAPPSQPQRPVLSIDQKRRALGRLRERIRELEDFDPETVQARFHDPEVMALEAAIDEALSAAFGHGTVEYQRYERAVALDHGPVEMRPIFDGRRYDDSFEARGYVATGKQEALALLGRAVRSLEEEIEDHEPDAAPPAASEPAPQLRDLSKVFVVHGHDEGTREAVARFLERLEIRPIILHEQASQGRTVIEKVEAHGDVGFAVVLLTPDDEGSVKGGTPAPRARQNVVLELGYFIGRLGRKYVCALKRGEVEIPSDFGGVVYETFDSGGGWKQALGRELHEAGYHIDWNIVMRA
jgi:predicted nucleotide-binding protein